MPTPPSFQKVNPADQPILYLAVSSPTLPLSDVDEDAETTMAQRISMVNGVAQVAGLRLAEVRRARAARSAQLAVARSASTKSTAPCKRATPILPPARSTERPHLHAAVQRPAAERGPVRPHDRRLPQRRAGAPGRIGRVIDSVQDDKTASWFNGDRAIVLAIQRQPGTNTVEVVNGIKTLLPRLAQQIPAAVASTPCTTARSRSAPPSTT